MFCLLTEFYDHINDKKDTVNTTWHVLKLLHCWLNMVKMNIEPNATDGINTLILLHIFKEPYLLGFSAHSGQNIGLFSDVIVMYLKIVGMGFILKFTVNEIPALYDLM